VSATLGEEGRGLWALLFAAGRPVAARRLARLLGCDEAEVERRARALAEHLEATGAPLAVEAIGSGYQLVLRPAYHALARSLVGEAPPRLSPAALESLAVVAYRQPVSRAEIERLRGVRADRSLAVLLERGLVREVAAPPGAAADGPHYATTDEFLAAFGLASLADLPPWTGEDARTRQAELSFGPPPLPPPGTAGGGDGTAAAGGG
jgi:segregation and condensation protein B